MQRFIAKFTYKKSAFTIVLAYLFLTGCAVSKLSNEKMENLGVFFIKPENNATVNQEVKIVMGVKGMNIRPAGDMTEKTGHHHLLIDEPPIASGTTIPKSPKHLHFGKGKRETIIKLTPGKHTLTLQFANGAHQSYGSKMRNSITVNVKQESDN